MSRIERKIAAVMVFSVGPLLALIVPAEIGWIAGALSGFAAANIWPVND